MFVMVNSPVGSDAFVGLGSNLGDRVANLNGAVEALGQTRGLTVRRVSSFHETEPVGGPLGQGMFLNAVAVLETNVEPVPLLHILQEVETRFGRQRTVRWGERTLDLDLLLFDGRIIDTPELCLPHPRMRTRRFVLEPLVEVAPWAVDPVTRRPFAAILADLIQNSG
jgi:2-amino-4-hydroxy-6-hydroxymethyldihydropteridine diphosphokinase